MFLFLPDNEINFLIKNTTVAAMQSVRRRMLISLRQKSPKPLNIIPFSKIFDTVIFIHNAVFQNLLAFGAYILELSFGLK